MWTAYFVSKTGKDVWEWERKKCIGRVGILMGKKRAEMTSAENKKSHFFSPTYILHYSNFILIFFWLWILISLL